MLLVFLVILIISFILALRSMKDFDMPNEIKKLLQNQKIRGTIIFLKDKIVHYPAQRDYSSDSSSVSSVL